MVDVMVGVLADMMVGVLPLRGVDVLPGVNSNVFAAVMDFAIPTPLEESSCWAALGCWLVAALNLQA